MVLRASVVYVLIFYLVLSPSSGSSELHTKKVICPARTCEVQSNPFDVNRNDAANGLKNPRNFETEPGDMFSDISDNSNIKKISEVHDNGYYTSLCWIEITTITERKNGSKSATREYAITFETPSDIPEQYLSKNLDVEEEETVQYKIFDRDTKKSEVVNFTTVSKSEESIVRQNRKILCGSGPVYTKEFFEWPHSDRKRVEIRVSPKRQNLVATDCVIGTEEEFSTLSPTRRDFNSEKTLLNQLNVAENYDGEDPINRKINTVTTSEPIESESHTMIVDNSTIPTFAPIKKVKEQEQTPTFKITETTYPNSNLKNQTITDSTLQDSTTQETLTTNLSHNTKDIPNSSIIPKVATLSNLTGKKSEGLTTTSLKYQTLRSELDSVNTTPKKTNPNDDTQPNLNANLEESTPNKAVTSDTHYDGISALQYGSTNEMPITIKELKPESRQPGQEFLTENLVYNTKVSKVTKPYDAKLQLTTESYSTIKHDSDITQFNDLTSTSSEDFSALTTGKARLDKSTTKKPQEIIFSNAEISEPLSKSILVTPSKSPESLVFDTVETNNSQNSKPQTEETITFSDALPELAETVRYTVSDNVMYDKSTITPKTPQILPVVATEDEKPFPTSQIHKNNATNNITEAPKFHINSVNDTSATRTTDLDTSKNHVLDSSATTLISNKSSVTVNIKLTGSTIKPLPTISANLSNESPIDSTFNSLHTQTTKLVRAEKLPMEPTTNFSNQKNREPATNLFENTPTGGKNLRSEEPTRWTVSPQRDLTKSSVSNSSAINKSTPSDVDILANQFQQLQTTTASSEDVLDTKHTANPLLEFATTLKSLPKETRITTKNLNNPVTFQIPDKPDDKKTSDDVIIFTTVFSHPEDLTKSETTNPNQPEKENPFQNSRLSPSKLLNQPDKHSSITTLKPTSPNDQSTRNVTSETLLYKTPTVVENLETLGQETKSTSPKYTYGTDINHLLDDVKSENLLLSSKSTPTSKHPERVTSPSDETTSFVIYLSNKVVPENFTASDNVVKLTNADLEKSKNKPTEAILGNTTTPQILNTSTKNYNLTKLIEEIEHKSSNATSATTLGDSEATTKHTTLSPKQVFADTTPINLSTVLENFSTQTEQFKEDLEDQHNTIQTSTEHSKTTVKSGNKLLEKITPIRLSTPRLKDGTTYSKSLLNKTLNLNKTLVQDTTNTDTNDNTQRTSLSDSLNTEEQITLPSQKVTKINRTAKPFEEEPVTADYNMMKVTESYDSADIVSFPNESIETTTVYPIANPQKENVSAVNMSLPQSVNLSKKPEKQESKEPGIINLPIAGSNSENLLDQSNVATTAETTPLIFQKLKPLSPSIHLPELDKQKTNQTPVSNNSRTSVPEISNTVSSSLPITILYFTEEPGKTKQPIINVTLEALLKNFKTTTKQATLPPKETTTITDFTTRTNGVGITDSLNNFLFQTSYPNNESEKPVKKLPNVTSQSLLDYFKTTTKSTTLFLNDTKKLDGLATNSHSSSVLDSFKTPSTLNPDQKLKKVEIIGKVTLETLADHSKTTTGYSDVSPKETTETVQVATHTRGLGIFDDPNLSTSTLYPYHPSKEVDNIYNITVEIFSDHSKTTTDPATLAPKEIFTQVNYFNTHTQRPDVSKLPASLSSQTLNPNKQTPAQNKLTDDTLENLLNNSKITTEHASLPPRETTKHDHYDTRTHSQPGRITNIPTGLSYQTLHTNKESDKSEKINNVTLETLTNFSKTTTDHATLSSRKSTKNNHPYTYGQGILDPATNISQQTKNSNEELEQADKLNNVTSTDYFTRTTKHKTVFPKETTKIHHSETRTPGPDISNISTNLSFETRNPNKKPKKTEKLINVTSANLLNDSKMTTERTTLYLKETKKVDDFDIRTYSPGTISVSPLLHILYSSKNPENENCTSEIALNHSKPTTKQVTLSSGQATTINDFATRTQNLDNFKVSNTTSPSTPYENKKSEKIILDQSQTTTEHVTLHPEQTKNINGFPTSTRASSSSTGRFKPSQHPKGANQPTNNATTISAAESTKVTSTSTSTTRKPDAAGISTSLFAKNEKTRDVLESDITEEVTVTLLPYFSENPITSVVTENVVFVSDVTTEIPAVDFVEDTTSSSKVLYETGYSNEELNPLKHHTTTELPEYLDDVTDEGFVSEVTAEEMYGSTEEYEATTEHSKKLTNLSPYMSTAEEIYQTEAEPHQIKIEIPSSDEPADDYTQKYTLKTDYFSSKEDKSKAIEQIETSADAKTTTSPSDTPLITEVDVTSKYLENQFRTTLEDDLPQFTTTIGGNYDNSFHKEKSEEQITEEADQSHWHLLQKETSVIPPILSTNPHQPQSKIEGMLVDQKSEPESLELTSSPTHFTPSPKHTEADLQPPGIYVTDLPFVESSSGTESDLSSYLSTVEDTNIVPANSFQDEFHSLPAEDIAEATNIDEVTTDGLRLSTETQTSTPEAVVVKNLEDVLCNNTKQKVLVKVKILLEHILEEEDNGHVYRQVIPLKGVQKNTEFDVELKNDLSSVPDKVLDRKWGGFLDDLATNFFLFNKDAVPAYTDLQPKNLNLNLPGHGFADNMLTPNETERRLQGIRYLIKRCNNTLRNNALNNTKGIPNNNFTTKVVPLRHRYTTGDSNKNLFTPKPPNNGQENDQSDFYRFLLGSSPKHLNNAAIQERSNFDTPTQHVITINGDSAERNHWHKPRVLLRRIPYGTQLSGDNRPEYRTFSLSDLFPLQSNSAINQHLPRSIYNRHFLKLKSNVVQPNRVVVPYDYGYLSRLPSSSDNYDVQIPFPRISELQEEVAVNSDPKTLETTDLSINRPSRNTEKSNVKPVRLKFYSKDFQKRVEDTTTHYVGLRKQKLASAMRILQNAAELVEGSDKIRERIAFQETPDDLGYHASEKLRDSLSSDQTNSDVSNEYRLLNFQSVLNSIISKLSNALNNLSKR